MRNFCPFVLSISLLLSSCAAPIIESVLIESDFPVLAYHMEKHEYYGKGADFYHRVNREHGPVLVMDQGSILSLIPFGPQFIDQYLYLIERYEEAPATSVNAYTDLGDAMGFSKRHFILKFSVHYFDGKKLLGINYCGNGQCDRDKEVYIEEGMVPEFRKILLGYQQRIGVVGSEKTMRSPQEGSSIVYVYRLHSVPFSDAEIQINGTHVFDLPEDGCVSIELPPEEYEFSSDWSFFSGVADSGTRLSVEENQTYYLRYTTLLSGYSYGGLNLNDVFYDRNGWVNVPEVIAKQDIDECAEASL